MHAAEKLDEQDNARPLAKVTPRLGQELAALLKSSKTLFRAADLHNGPVHLIVPQAMDRNIAAMKQTFENLGLSYRIFYAHKACKSPALARQVRKNGAHIDVASRNELSSALAAGFTGAQIICTGPKNREFVRLAIQHGCLISCDSEDELEKIADTLDQHPDIASIDILLRISDIKSRDRSAIAATSRFGIPQDRLPMIFDWLTSVPRINLKGFHNHNDERNRDAKSGFVDNLLSLMEQAYAAGFSPDLVDIGGGLRNIRVANAQDWSDFIDQVAQGLLNKTGTGTWRNFGLGMSISEKGAIAGRERVQGKYASDEEFSDVLTTVLGNSAFRGRPLAEIMTENMFSIAVEPGFALLQQCGLTLLRVVGVKEAADGTPLVLVDGNIYSLSQGVTEILYDPFLIAREQHDDGGEFAANIIGNMCREEDVITKRRIVFPQIPREGDLICFANTAAYNSDFEDTNPHQHPMGRRFVAQQNKQGDWDILSEDAYSPYLEE
jgi:diaminopimelate decarboxylase